MNQKNPCVADSRPWLCLMGLTWNDCVLSEGLVLLQVVAPTGGDRYQEFQPSGRKLDYEGCGFVRNIVTVVPPHLSFFFPRCQELEASAVLCSFRKALPTIGLNMSSQLAESPKTVRKSTFLLYTNCVKCFLIVREIWSLIQDLTRDKSKIFTFKVALHGL